MQSTTAHWNLSQRIIFRFIFLLLLLFIIFFNNGVFPLMPLLMKYPLAFLHEFIPWIGRHILALPNEITSFTNGSGDTTYDYVVLLFITFFSIFGAIIWTVIDRKALNYNNLFYWLTVANANLW